MRQVLSLFRPDADTSDMDGGVTQFEVKNR